MEYETQPYIVYVKTDSANRITEIASSAFLQDTEGWTEIDRGYGNRYGHAQSAYLEESIMDELGIWRYKLEGGKVVERTQEEMDADYVAPVTGPSEEERIAALEAAMTAIEEGITGV